MKLKHLSLGVALLALAFSSTLAARQKKGDKFFKDAMAAELKQDWDTAVDLYQKAADADPTEQSYIIAMRRARFQDGQMHVNKGLKLRDQGKNADAIQEFQKAILIDPASAIALQELKRTQQMLQQPAASDQEKGLTPAERTRREEDRRVASMLAPPELKPVLAEVPPLKMNNQPPRVLYETVGKLAGINVVFDSQYTPPTRGFNVDLSPSSVEQAFDYLAVITHTFWKPISANTIFVTEDNVTKRRDYEDEVVKVFYITNATSTQEFQEIATAIRTVAEIRRVFTYNAQKAMVVRGPADAVALAEKLVRDLDKPKSEVVVDVIVMETDSTRTRDLTAALASLGSSGTPISFTPRSSIAINTSGSTATTGTTGTTGTTTTGTTAATTSTTSAISLANLGHVSTADFSTTLPGALLQAMLTDTRTKVMNRPQLRASDGMKVQLQIGNRIPYATGSFQPGVGTVGVSPLVSTQFQFADTGVTVDLTPQVHNREEVTLHIEVTISAVTQYITIGGTGGLSQPVISQRKNIADIRLHDGEVNILSGLSQSQDSSTMAGIPGLTNIPVLNNIFNTTNHTEKDREELLIALIPHIIRTPDYTPENMRGIYAGSDQVVKLSYAPRPATPPAPEPGPTSAVPAKPEPTAAAPAAVPGAAPPIAAAPAPSPTPTPAAAPGPTPPAAPTTPAAPTPVLFPPPAANAAGGPRVRFSPAAVAATRDTPFTIDVQVDNAPASMTGVAPLHIRWDPDKLRLNDITAGDLLLRGGVEVTADKHDDATPGEATVIVMRAEGSAGVSGAGAVAKLSFTATSAGSSVVSVTQAFVQDAQKRSVPATPGEVIVTVK